jgi:autoinducer 2-degrading protein
MLVVTTLYEIEADSVGLFRAAITKQAEVTRQREIGCRRYDVAFDPKFSTRCFVYALFADAPAYDHHILTDYFNTFGEVTLPWIASQTVEFWDLAASPSRVAASLS